MNKKLYEKLIQYILDHQDRFYRLAYSYTKNQEDALDAVQNAVCKALEAYALKIAYSEESIPRFAQGKGYNMGIVHVA